MSLLALFISFSVAAAAPRVAWASRNLENNIISNLNAINTHSRHLSMDNFQFPSGTGRVVVDETIKVKAGTTFDGEMKTYTMANKNSKDPIMRVRRGASLKNMVIEGRPGAGINFFGNNVVENVWFTDLQGGKAFRIAHNAADFNETNIFFNLTNCGVKNGHVALQVNTGGMKVSVTNFKIDNTAVGVFFCQKCKFPFNITPTTVTFFDSVFRYGADGNARVVQADPGDPTLITARGQPDKAILNLGPTGISLINKQERRICIGHAGMCESRGSVVNN